MKLNRPQKSMTRKIEEMQFAIKDAEEESTKAQAQEEILLKQLNELFECNSLEEGKELLDQLIDEKDEMDSDLESKTDDLYQSMKADGLI